MSGVASRASIGPVDLATFVADAIRAADDSATGRLADEIRLMARATEHIDAKIAISAALRAALETAKRHGISRAQLLEIFAEVA